MKLTIFFFYFTGTLCLLLVGATFFLGNTGHADIAVWGMIPMVIMFGIFSLFGFAVNSLPKAPAKS